MGNSTNCSSCGCGDKDQNTVHVDPNDARFAPQPYSSSAPPPMSAAHAMGRGTSRGGEDGPPTDRKDHSVEAYKQEQLEKYADRQYGERQPGFAGGGGYSHGGGAGADVGSNPFQQDVRRQEEDLEHRVERLADGSVFEGQFRGRDRHGWGKFTWATGGSYEGQFESNNMHGDGTYQWSDGSTYTGQWQDNNMGPKGVMQWTDGRKYEGQFRNGKKHGEGQLLWPDGRSYTGQWEAGKQHGYGTTVTGKGLSRKSQWEHGKLVRWLEDRGNINEPDVGGTPIRIGLLSDAPKGGSAEAAKGVGQGLKRDPHAHQADGAGDASP